MKAAKQGRKPVSGIRRAAQEVDQATQEVDQATQEVDQATQEVATQHPAVRGLAARIVAAHEMLDSLNVPHQFGGAIALAWYRSARATTDIDLNVTVHPKDMSPVLGALQHLGVTVSSADERAIARDGQARLEWEGSYLDLFCATLDFHQEMAVRARQVRFGPVQIPILSPEHLIVCKAIFNRPKDWVDIEEIMSWGTEVNGAEVLGWVDEMLGTDSAERKRLAELVGIAQAG